MCVAWGMVSACTGAVHSYAGLAICRVVLGVYLGLLERSS